MQALDKKISFSLRLSDCESILADMFEVEESDRSKLRARLKQLQRLDWPAAETVGQGPKERYWLEDLLQLVIVFELIELSMTTSRAAELARYFWPTFANAAANAWIEYQAERERRGEIEPRGDAPRPQSVNWRPILALIDVKDFDGLNKRDSLKEWKAARSAPLANGKKRSLPRLVVTGRLDALFNNSVSIGAEFNDAETRRAGVIDLTKVTAALIRRMEERDFFSALDFEYWCEVLIQMQLARID